MRRLLAAWCGLGVCRGVPFLLLALSLACSPAPASADSRQDDAAPRRVVSMNLCTDQLAMMMAAPGQLYSVSHLASEPTMSLMVEEARAYRTNHGLAEEIFQMQPDLILVGAMTTRATVAMLKRLGFPVVEFPYENSFDEMRANIRRMGEVLHRREKADEMLERFDADLERLRQRRGAPRTAVLHHASSYTSGAGTLANEILDAAGYDNVAAGLGLSGMVKLPLEQLVLAAPDLVVTDATWEGAPALAQQTFSHPALRALEATSARAIVANKRWVCATPSLINLIDELSAARMTNGSSERQHDHSKARQ